MYFKMKKPYHRILLLLLCLLFLFSACKAKEQENPEGDSIIENAETETENTKKIRLPYFVQDGLNPYFAVSAENRALAFLYAEPLYKVKSDYNAEPILALDCERDGTKMTVTLDTQKFSDGTSISPKDVVYSFQKAKESNWYGARLSKIKSAKAQKNSVLFELTEPNIYAENLLTFPIVKANSAESQDQIPVGSGPYVLKADATAEKNANNLTSSGALQIELVEIRDFSYLKNALEIGNISFMFTDFQKGSYERVVSENTFVTLNNLCYLGINHQAMPLHSAALRTAIFYAIDKEGVASSAYQGCAEAVSFPVHPDAQKAMELKTPQTKADTKKAKDILYKIGYNRKNKDGLLVHENQTLQMSVLCNEDNPFRVAAASYIVDTLNELGFSASLESVPYDTYLARLQSGNYTLYVGEVKLPEDLDLSAFFGMGSASNYMDSNLPVFASALGWHRGENTIDVFLEDFLDDMPFVPLCYRDGMAAYEKGLTPDFSMAAYGIPGNFGAWSMSIPE